MSNAGRKILAAVIFALLSAIGSADGETQLKCDLTPQDYQDRNYAVREVRFDTPLEWLFGSIKEGLKDLLLDPEMPIKPGKAFLKADFNDSLLFVRSHFPELTVTRAERVKVRIAKPGLANCDEQAKSLDVVYHVYTFGFSYYLTRAFETGAKDEVKRSVVETSATKVEPEPANVSVNVCDTSEPAMPTDLAAKLKPSSVDEAF